MESIVKYSWPQRQSYPKLSVVQKEELEQLELAVEADKVPTTLLDPHQLIPTVSYVDSVVVQNLIDVEYVPAIIVIRVGNQLFIYDGHHRATRARLDNQVVRSVVYNLE